MGLFDNVSLEDIESCFNQEISAGISTRILYTPACFLYGFVLPTGESFAQNIDIPSGDMEFEDGKTWSYFDCLTDENELKVMLSGPTGKKKLRSQLDLFALGLSSKILGFLEAVANVPLIFAIPDQNGKMWILGNKRNGAFIEKADGTTGKKYEDNSGFAITISANTTIYNYTGDIHNFNTSGGDFNTDFNIDFNI